MTGPLDWHSRSFYDGLPGLRKAGWAWEFLRRNPGYRADFADADAPAEAVPCARARRWGLPFPP
jgi:hypothetical protein